MLLYTHTRNYAMFVSQQAKLCIFRCVTSVAHFFIERIIKMTKGFVVERTVDRLGRIVIPKDMRKIYNVDIGSKVVVTATDGSVIIKPAKSNPTLNKSRDK